MKTTSKYNPGSKRQPFPKVLPRIAIKPSKAKPFSVDCKELRWWHGVPDVGDSTMWGTYDPPRWTLSEATEMVGLREARVNDVAGVEIQVNEWDPDNGWKLDSWTMYGELTDTNVRWLATSKIRDGERVIDTFLEKGFKQDWGEESPRLIEDRGRFVLQKDGTYKQKQTKRCMSSGAIGAGMFRVLIGERLFTCLRVLDCQDRVSEKGLLLEVYLTQQGRTALFRRYNGRLWHVGARGQPWEKRLPNAKRIVIDGRVYVHWYDSLIGLSCGIRP